MRKVTIFLPMLAFILAIGAAVASDQLNDTSVPLFRYVLGSCLTCDENPANATQCTTNNTGPICHCRKPFATAYLATPSQCLLLRRPPED